MVWPRVSASSAIVRSITSDRESHFGSPADRQEVASPITVSGELQWTDPSTRARPSLSFTRWSSAPSTLRSFATIAPRMPRLSSSVTKSPKSFFTLLHSMFAAKNCTSVACPLFTPTRSSDVFHASRVFAKPLSHSFALFLCSKSCVPCRTETA